MLGILKKLLQKLVTGMLLLYSYNMIVPSTIIIPLNVITIILTTLFGIKTIPILVIFKYIIG